MSGDSNTVITSIGGVVASLGAVWMQARKTKAAVDIAVENATLKGEIKALRHEIALLKGQP